MSVAVVSIPVSDVDRAKAFYSGTLGFALLEDQQMGSDMRWVQLQPQDGGATVALTTWFDNLKPGGQQGLMIGIEDVDTEYERLKGLGLDLSPPDDQPWGRFTMLKDPDGNGLILAKLTNPDQVKTR